MAVHAATLKQQQMNLLKATNAANNLLQTHDARTMKGQGNIKIDLMQIEGNKNGAGVQNQKENPSHTPRSGAN